MGLRGGAAWSPGARAGKDVWTDGETDEGSRSCTAWAFLGGALGDLLGSGAGFERGLLRRNPVFHGAAVHVEVALRAHVG